MDNQDDKSEVETRLQHAWQPACRAVVDAPTQYLHGVRVSSPTSLAAVLWQGVNLLEGLCWRCNSSLEDPSLQSSLVLHQGSNLQEKTGPEQPKVCLRHVRSLAYPDMPSRGV